jgi:hypothetical protein
MEQDELAPQLAELAAQEEEMEVNSRDEADFSQTFSTIQAAQTTGTTD